MCGGMSADCECSHTLRELGGRVLDPEQMEIPCHHGEVIAYDHGETILASCRSCGKTMDLGEWLMSRNWKAK